jgi:hypothetical protein
VTRPAARLLHDVGKYVARTAHNLPAGAALDEELVAMLARDLYELGGDRRRASALVDEAALAGPRIAAARALLGEADALEPALRRGERGAVERACAIALEVERLLRAEAAA